MITDRILIRLRPAIILVRLDEGPITVQVLTPVTTDKPKHGTRDTAKIKKPNWWFPESAHDLTPDNRMCVVRV